jgi:hypothetical protein
MRSQNETTLVPGTKPSSCRSESRTTLTMLATLCLGLGTCAPAAVLGESRLPGSPEKPCGPPSYCARTDRRVEPYPKTPLILGPAGFTFTDPSFGSRMVRATDTRTDPDRVGRSFHTPSSSEQNSWNATSTKFYVTEAGGQTILFDFEPSTMAVHKVGTLNPSWRSEPQFSYSQPNLLFGVTKRHPEFQQYDVATHKTTTLHDPSSCLKLDPSDYGSDVSVSADGRRFMAVIGPQQDRNYLVYIHDREAGCRWYNTKTGEIGGQWGPKGTISSPQRFGVHNARMSKSGDFVSITGGNAGPVLWEIGTLNTTLCSQRAPYNCGGHHALGYSHMVNPSGRSDPMDLLVRPLNNPTSTKLLVTNLPALSKWFDKHLSWNNADPDDTAPVCFSTYRHDSPTTPGAPLPVDRPWDNEIMCVAVDGKASIVWRFAHTYSTATNGFWSTPRGNVSPDGRFYIFTSDWQNELGTDANGHGYRTDVFVVELR